MGIPASALRDDELLHYAGLEPEAAAELSRRIAEGGLDPGAERADLRDEVARLEGSLGDLEDEKDKLDDSVAEACLLLWRAVEHDEDEELTVSQLIKLALDKLE